MISTSKGRELPVTVIIELSMWQANHQILIDAKDNANELLADHMDKLGNTTKKNVAIAKMYESEIRKITAMLDYSNSTHGVPF